VATPAAAAYPDLATGDDFLCLLDDEGVRCWGSGVPSWVSTPEVRIEPLVAGTCEGDGCREAANARYVVLDHPTTLVAGGKSACAFDRQGLKCFGGSPEVNAIPAAVRGTAVKDVVLGFDYACAKVGGTLHCWGKGRDRQPFHRQTGGSDTQLNRVFEHVSVASAVLVAERAGICAYGPAPAAGRPIRCQDIGSTWVTPTPSHGLNAVPTGETMLMPSAGAASNPCFLQTSVMSYPLGISCMEYDRVSHDYYEWNRQIDRLTGNTDIKQVLASGVPYANMSVCLRDGGGVRCGRVRFFQEFNGKYVEELAGSRKIVFAATLSKDAVRFGGVCGLLDESIRCVSAESLHEDFAWRDFLARFLRPSVVGFRLDRLPESLRAITDCLYVDKRAVAEKAADLAQDASEPGRHYILKLLVPFFEGLSTPYLETRVKPQLARSVAHYDAQTGRTTLDAFPDDAETRKARLTFLATSFACLKPAAAQADRPALDLVISKAGAALAQGATMAGTRDAQSAVVAVRPLLESLAAARASAACGLLALTLAGL